MKTPEGLRDDSFVNCVRDETKENVPKIETKALKDAIIKKTRSGKGKMTVGEFVNIVESQYKSFLRRLRETWTGSAKAGFISTAAGLKGYDPTGPKGRKWWINQVGGKEDAMFINEYMPQFDMSKSEFPFYFDKLQLCLAPVTPMAMMSEDELKGMKKKKKKKKEKKEKKKSPKKKKSKKKKKKKKTTRRTRRNSH
jgi:hypothetical protein